MHGLRSSAPGSILEKMRSEKQKTHTPYLQIRVLWVCGGCESVKTLCCGHMKGFEKATDFYIKLEDEIMAKISTKIKEIEKQKTQTLNL